MFDLVWPIWVFVLLIALAVFVFAKRITIALLLVALILYFGTQWDVYLAAVVIFWVAVIATLIGLCGRFLGRWRSYSHWQSIALCGSILAVFLAFIFATSGSGWINTQFGNDTRAARGFAVPQPPDSSTLSKDIQRQLAASAEAIKAEAKARSTEDAKLWNAIRSLQNSDKKQNGRLSVLEKKADEAKKLEDSATTPSDAPSKVVADALAGSLTVSGWKSVKVADISWNQNESDDTVGKFGPRIDSQKKLKQAILNNANLRSHIEAATMPAQEKARALRGVGYIPLQFEEDDVCYSGNMLIKNGRAVRGKPNCSLRGDVVWAYVGTDGKVYWDASVRADCANPGMTQPPVPYALALICPSGSARSGQMQGAKPC